MSKKLAAIDAETKGIKSRPDYPPKAVGYAVKFGRTCKYLAFGHPSKNNCTRGEAIQFVKRVVKDHVPVFHNADFDLEVMEQDGIKVRGEYHDTLKMAFLNEPRSSNLGLKPQSEEWLGWPPEEQDMLRQWIIDNVPAAKKRKKQWGAYICEAPGSLVGVYAKGDVKRTDGLFKFFKREVLEGGMTEAYKREMALIPIKLDMEQHGIKVRMRKLKREIGAYIKVRDNMERNIQRRLGAKINIGSPKQLADALIKRDLLSKITRTAKGNVSTKRVLLEQNCTDKKLVQMLAVHGTLETYLGTFLQRWIDIGEINDNYAQPSFNTTRSSDEYGSGRGKGARTGRFSSSDPNFQNIPTNAEESQHWEILQVLAKLLAKQGVNFIGLRDYFEPDEGCVFLRRDYNQQELRILAHFEEGDLLDMYLADPTMDAHDAVRLLVAMITGLDFPRKHIKTTNFGIVYGMGIAKLAARLDLEPDAARTLKRAVLKAVPGIKDLMSHLRGLAKEDEPFFTWGGREYYCEEPDHMDTPDGGRIRRTFEYKMLNTLIQGSAADCTKQGMINTWENMNHGRLVLQVHDELVASVPKEHAKKEMVRMREAMEDVKFRLPMLSDGEIGVRSWAKMKKVGDHRG